MNRVITARKMDKRRKQEKKAFVLDNTLSSLAANHGEDLTMKQARYICRIYVS